MKYLLIVLVVITMSALSPLSAQINYHPKQKNQTGIDLHPDSIRLEFPEQQAVIIFKLKRFMNNSEFIADFPKILAEHIAYIKKGTTDQTTPRRVTIEYQPDEKKSITIEPVSDKTVITTYRNTITELLPPAWEIHMTTKLADVYVYSGNFENLESLSNQDLTPVVTTIKADPGIASIGKKRIHARIIIKGGKIDHTAIRYQYPLDMLSLEAHTGLGLLGDKFYPELNFSVGLFLTGRYGFYDHRLEVLYNNMIFGQRQTEGGFSTDINSFISFSYSRNLNRKNEHSRWTGIGAGYLVRNRGDYFTGKTMKVFMSIDLVSDKLNLVPELYLTDDLKKGMVGIKLNYRFLW